MISLLLHASYGSLYHFLFLVLIISLVYINIGVINVISYSLSMPVLTRSQVKNLPKSTTTSLVTSTNLTSTGSTDGLLRSASPPILTGSHDELSIVTPFTISSTDALSSLNIPPSHDELSIVTPFMISSTDALSSLNIPPTTESSPTINNPMVHDASLSPAPSYPDLFFKFEISKTMASLENLKFSPTKLSNFEQNQTHNFSVLTIVKMEEDCEEHGLSDSNSLTTDMTKFFSLFSSQLSSYMDQLQT